MIYYFFHFFKFIDIWFHHQQLFKIEHPDSVVGVGVVSVLYSEVCLEYAGPRFWKFC
jgi:hypothetical protein